MANFLSMESNTKHTRYGVGLVDYETGEMKEAFRFQLTDCATFLMLQAYYEADAEFFAEWGVHLNVETFLKALATDAYATHLYSMADDEEG